MSFLDDLLLGLKRVTIAGGAIALTGPVSTINFVSGATAVYNSATQAYDVTITGGGGGSVTWGDDLAGSNSSAQQWVAAISGPGGGGALVPMHTVGLQFDAAQTSASLSQATATSDVAPTNLSIAPQAPFASAVTHKSPGALNLDIAAPVTGGAEGGVFVRRGGTAAVRLGVLSSTLTSAFLHLGSTAVASPTSTNAAVLVNANVGGTTALQSVGRVQLIAIPNTGTIDMVINGQIMHQVAGQLGAGYSLTLGSQLGFFFNVQNPVIGQGIAGLNVATTPLTIIAGAANASSSSGGTTSGAPVLVQGGDSTLPGTTGTRGGVRLQVGQGTPGTLVEVGEIAVGRRFSALNQVGTGLTGTQLPANTGDGVTWIGNAQTIPTASPVGGAILYATAGALWVYQSNGANFQIASAGGGGVTWSSDLAGSTNTTQYVAALSGNNSSTNAIPLRSGAYIAATANEPIIQNGSGVLLSTDANPQIILGGSAGGPYLGFVVFGTGTTLVSLSGGNDFVRFGGTPATTGDIRTTQGDVAVSARNASNTADQALVSSDGSNNTVLGSTLGAGSGVICKAAGAISTTLQLQSSSSDFIAMGGTGCAVTGQIRVINGTTIVSARNASNSADLPVVTTDASNSVFIGATTGVTNSELVASTSCKLNVSGSIVLNATTIAFTVNSPLVLTAQTVNTSASIGSHGAAPATVAGYLAMSINGSSYNVPLYN